MNTLNGRWKKVADLEMVIYDADLKGMMADKTVIKLMQKYSVEKTH